MKENGDKEIGIDYWKFCKILHEKKKQFGKVYRTVYELGIQAFTKQSSRKFTKLSRIKCETFRKNH